MKLNVIETDKTHICFVGDIHGDFTSLSGFMKQYEFKDTLVILCGDIGFGFEKLQHYTNIFNKITKTAAKYNCEFMMVRGNHDSKSFFDGKVINRKYFKAVPDYTVIKTPIYNILCVGGATSIDRTYRLKVLEKNAAIYSRFHTCSLNEAKKLCQQVYWEDEQPIYDEEALNQLNELGIKIDIVATHTCPSFAKPITKDGIQYWLTYDQKLNEDIDNERKVMDDIYNKLVTDGHPLSKWFYGHYHYHNQEYIDNVHFIMLDMCRDSKLDFYDLDGITNSNIE